MLVGKKAQQFKALPWWAKLGTLVFALMIGGCVYFVASGVQEDAAKKDAISTCSAAVVSNGGVVVGTPTATKPADLWVVDGHAETRSGLQGWDCFVENGKPDFEFTAP